MNYEHIGLVDGKATWVNKGTGATTNTTPLLLPNDYLTFRQTHSQKEATHHYGVCDLTVRHWDSLLREQGHDIAARPNLRILMAPSRAVTEEMFIAAIKAGKSKTQIALEYNIGIPSVSKRKAKLKKKGRL